MQTDRGTAARNVVASLEHRETGAYRHKDLGFVVDLTGRNATGTPRGLIDERYATIGAEAGAVGQLERTVSGSRDV